MASYTMHLAIAKMYLKTHKENEEDFYKGTIDVDDVLDKAITHYSTNSNETNAKKWLESKVGLKKYIEEHSIKTSYDRGYFLHLLADYYLYNCYFDDNMLKSMENSEYTVHLYHDYDILNGHLIKKYDIEKPKRLKERFFATYEGDLEMMTYESVDQYIDFISKLDIDELYSKIKNSEDILYLYHRKEI